MVDQVLDPPEPPGADWPHEWNRYDQYRHIHDRRLRDVEERLLYVGGGRTWDEAREGGQPVAVLVHGDLALAKQVVLEVTKSVDLRVRPDGHLEARGSVYRYHARLSRPGFRAIPLISYDCTAHFGGEQNAHIDNLHRHTYDRWNRELVEPIRLEQLPNLHSLIEYSVELASYRLAAMEEAAS